LQELERAWMASRSGLFLESSGSLASADLKFIFLENVPALAVRGLDRVLLELHALGYDARWTIVSAAEVGAPHLRDESGFLPTPAASEYGSNQSPSPGAQVRPSLSSMARKIPTPRASDGSKGGPNQSLHGEPSLTSLAVSFPTPAARDGKDGWTPKRHGRHSPSVAVAVAVAVAESGHRGFLNPRFVEVLMGLPIGWTRLEDWATAWFRSQRGKRLSASQESEEQVK
jgi:hypothetical protein